jgi:hypothetical protein
MRITIITFLSLFMLSGCFWTKDLAVKTEPVDRIKLVTPDVDEYHHRKVEWIVITPENVDEVFAELKKKGKPVVVIALTSKGYENLALNTGDQQVLIKQLKSIIEAYEEYYIAVEKRDDEHNKKAKSQEKN